MQLGDHLAAGAEKYALEEKQRAERRVRSNGLDDTHPHVTSSRRVGCGLIVTSHHIGRSMCVHCVGPCPRQA